MLTTRVFANSRSQHGLDQHFICNCARRNDRDGRTLALQWRAKKRCPPAVDRLGSAGIRRTASLFFVVEMVAMKKAKIRNYWCAITVKTPASEFRTRWPGFPTDI